MKITDGHFTDEHFKQLKHYIRTKDEYTYNVWVYPFLRKTADVYYSYIFNCDGNSNRYHIESMITHLTLNLHKLDLRLSREQCFAYICKMAVLKIKNDQKSYIVASKRTVELEHPVNEEGDTLKDILTKEDTEYFFSDSKEEMDGFVQFWMDKERVLRVFGGWEHNRKIRDSFRCILSMLKGRNREGTKRKKTNIPKKHISVISRLMREEMRQSGKFEKWFEKID